MTWPGPNTSGKGVGFSVWVQYLGSVKELVTLLEDSTLLRRGNKAMPTAYI